MLKSIFNNENNVEFVKAKQEQLLKNIKELDALYCLHNCPKRRLAKCQDAKDSVGGRRPGHRSVLQSLGLRSAVHVSCGANFQLNSLGIFGHIVSQDSSSM